MSERAEELVGQAIGPYRIIEPIGEGGMGSVYLAEGMGMVVALKLMRPDLENVSEAGRRFEREMVAASRVAHSSLVEVKDFGEADDYRYIAMEFVEGEDLSQALARVGTMSIGETKRVLSDIGLGLDALHGIGIVHRDIKPGNILIDRGEGFKLTDFGLARKYTDAADTGLTAFTATGQLVGTVRYVAPELLMGEPPGPHSDIFALGCVGYRCLSGRSPFEGEGLMEIGMSILDDDPIDPMVYRGEEANEVSELVMRALQKNPIDRMESASDFARTI